MLDNGHTWAMDIPTSLLKKQTRYPLLRIGEWHASLLWRLTLPARWKSYLPFLKLKEQLWNGLLLTQSFGYSSDAFALILHTMVNATTTVKQKLKCILVTSFHYHLAGFPIVWMGIHSLICTFFMIYLTTTESTPWTRLMQSAWFSQSHPWLMLPISAMQNMKIQAFADILNNWNCAGTICYVIWIKNLYYNLMEHARYFPLN